MLERKPKKLTEYDGLIVDLDGVVWRGKKPIKENINALNKALENGVKLVFLTNNSTRARYQIAEMIKEAGINAVGENVINSAYATASWIRDNIGRDAKIGVVGEEGLIAELTMAGLRVYTLDSNSLDVIVVGLDRNVTYRKLSQAMEHLTQGSMFIATNTDKALPRENGLSPGAGSIIKLLEEATGRRPDFIAGKPSKWIGQLALQILKSSGDIAVIGDRIDTDMELARRIGVNGILVLTGASRGRVYQQDFIVVRNLSEIV